MSISHERPVSAGCAVLTDAATARIWTAVKSRNRFRHLATWLVVSIGLLSAAIFLMWAPTAHAAEPFSVLQINMCNSGLAPCYTGHARTRTGDLINARRPSVVTLNESCLADQADIERRTGYHGVFSQSGSQTCKNGSPYGNMILVSHGTAIGTPSRTTYDAQDGGTEKRTLMCAPTTGVTACVTHLALRTQKAQAEQMKRIVGDLARRGPTVLGGDWNVTYPAAQRYVPSGMFRKGDGDVQHIMATTGFRFVRSRSMDLDWTDHPGWQVYLTRYRDQLNPGGSDQLNPGGSDQLNPAAPPSSPPPSPRTWPELQSSRGANTFLNPFNASGVGPRIPANQWVDALCKVYAPEIKSANPDGYWYRIASSPWSNAYYAVANTFRNGDIPGHPPYTHNTDWSVPDC